MPRFGTGKARRFAMRPNGMHNVHIGELDALDRKSPRRSVVSSPRSETHFRHEALLHAGDDEFLSGTLPFIEDAMALEEPVLVAVGGHRIQLLRETVGSDALSVWFTDIQTFGRNPARIIPAWHRFLEHRAAGGRPARGVGEPVRSGLRAAELSECQRHETLLNVAFADGQPWRLLCTYDIDALEDSVIEAARVSHPLITSAGASCPSDVYEPIGDPFAGTLPAPAGQPREMEFSLAEMSSVRSLVSEVAGRASLGRDRTEDLVLAVSELAANSLCHGGGTGTLLMWTQDGTLMCEVRDRGHITHPLVGRVVPTPDQQSGRGLWLVNQLCDLTQIRSSLTGTSVRVHMRLP